MIERGNVMDPELAIFFLSELDGMIQSDIMLHGPEEIVSYTDQEQELLLRKPHDGVYVHFLVAMIRQVQEEFEGYNNAQGIVNEKLETFREWYVAHYDPAETASREYMGAAPGGAGYGFAYLTAYGLAVKHGYSGTEEEWLQSLEGQPGDPGEAARMRFDEERSVIQWGVGEQWYDLFTLEELKDPVVEELMAQVRALADAAADSEAAAKSHAKTAADAAADALGSAGQAYAASQQSNKYAFEANESAKRAAASEAAAVTAAGDAQVQAETAEGYAIQSEAAAVGAKASAEIALGAARDISTAIAQHDSSTRAHGDLRLELQALRGYVTTLLDSDDTTLDQLSEIVGYIKSNRSLIEAVTTGKVSVGDIINDLTTNVPGKPLSAAMGVELAARVGALAARVAVTAEDAGALAMVREDGSLGPVKVGDNLELQGGRLNATGGGECSHRPTALVSFMDDDCRSATYSVLFPLAQELGVPLTVACAPGELGATAGTYMSTGQLQEMHRAGVEVSCHHWKQDNMDTFATAEDYAADLDSCLARFAELGTPVDTVAYPQGVYADGYMHVVRERLRAGFGVFRGINEPPLESYFLRRCELFPTKGEYTLDDAKALVDDVAREGGWLIFMSHAWYPTFDPVAFRELVEYIRGKGVEIVGTSEALNRIGNAVEVGLFRKPVEDLTEPYFVTDCEGRTVSEGWEAVPLALRTGKVINTTGPVVTTSDGEYCVSEQVDVSGQETVLVSAWASDGRGLLVFYDADGNRKAVRYSARSWADGGERLTNEEVAVPEGAATIAIAGYFRQQMPGLKIVQVGGGNVELDTTLTQSGKAADAKATGDALDKKLEKTALDGAIQDALARATESGEFDGEPGEDGITPHIGANGNWWIGGTDTGLPSRGAPGEPGKTPVKGADYFTSEEIQEVAELAAGMVEVPGGSGGGGGGSGYSIEVVPAAEQNTWTLEVGYRYTFFTDSGTAQSYRLVGNSGARTISNTVPQVIECYQGYNVASIGRSGTDALVFRTASHQMLESVTFTPTDVANFIVIKERIGGAGNA